MSIRFQRLDDLPIGLSPAPVMAALEPFVCAQSAASVRFKQIAGLRRTTLKRVARRLVKRGSRNKAIIVDEYDTTWSRRYAAYDLSAGCRRPEPWLYRGSPITVDRAGVARMRSVILAAVIRHLKPARVLEAGCGNGINLLLLAGAFPDIEFAGLELTSAGNRVARELQQLPELPAALSHYAPEPQRDGKAFQRIDFRQGDATRMPFADGAFDLVFTVLAVEQMERVRDAALTEIARVSRSHVLNLEPFADANRNIWRRMHVFGRDYFRGSIADLPRYGLQPEWGTVDYPQEIQLGSALVLSRKTR
ncbi:hypothetical protein BH10PSE7_BH10PSE7_13910 [soil metagenome]